jgi:uncharacterized protein with FMN-binding domain
MRRVTLWLASTAVLVMLLFSYHTSTDSGGGASPAAVGPSVPGGTGSAGSSGSSGSSGSAGSTGSSGSSAGGTFTGPPVDTRWGPVQVQITVAGGRITDVRAVVYPQGNPRDVEINNYALPRLHDEVITAQSAGVDAVSGATVTSDGYLSSLQSAIDAAHLGG